MSYVAHGLMVLPLDRGVGRRNSIWTRPACQPCLSISHMEPVMELGDREESENVEDRRGMGVGPKAGMAIGGGGIAIVAFIIWTLLGGDPQQFKDIQKKIAPPEQQQQGQPGQRRVDPEEEK